MNYRDLAVENARGEFGGNKEATVTIPLNLALLIDKVYLPSNPNKLRTAHPDVIKAVRDFKDLIRSALASAR